jgi:hypothetical protein
MQFVGAGRSRASAQGTCAPDRVSRYTAQAFHGHRGFGRYLETPDGAREKNAGAV